MVGTTATNLDDVVGIEVVPTAVVVVVRAATRVEVAAADAVSVSRAAMADLVEVGSAMSMPMTVAEDASEANAESDLEARRAWWLGAGRTDAVAEARMATTDPVADGRIEDVMTDSIAAGSALETKGAVRRRHCSQSRVDTTFGTARHPGWGDVPGLGERCEGQKHMPISLVSMIETTLEAKGVYSPSAHCSADHCVPSGPARYVDVGSDCSTHAKHCKRHQIVSPRFKPVTETDSFDD